jgi:hypothetical protein
MPKRRDRSADSEIEVTPAMIEAGVKVLRESGYSDVPMSSDPELVRDILLSALRTRRAE